MSELTLCNHCSLNHMRWLAIRTGVTVILDTNEEGWVTARFSDRDEPSAWFMELTDHCVC